jgi:hypothetical protein
MAETDEIILTLPQEREFHRVAHLVLGGLALRLNLTLETLEDLQLALAAILDRAATDEQITVTLSLHDGVLETVIEPVELRNELDGEVDGEQLDLGRILRTVVDGVEYEGSTVRLTKRIGDG